jgi:hypothetical protein
MYQLQNVANEHSKIVSGMWSTIGDIGISTLWLIMKKHTHSQALTTDTAFRLLLKTHAIKMQD